MMGRLLATFIGLSCFCVANSGESTTADDALTHAERGVQFAKAGDLSHAEAELRQAVQLAPKDASYLTSLGGILGMEQKLAEANIYFEKAVNIDPANAPARRNLAANQWRLGQFKQAQANLEQLLREQPHDQIAILLLGMVSENERDYVRSARLLASVPELVKQRPESVAALASSYYHTGHRDQARQTLEPLLGNPESPQGVFAAAGVAAQARDYEIAEKLFKSIRSTYPNRAALDYNLALIQFQTGRLAQSQTTLLKLVDSGEGNSEIYNLLGAVEMKMSFFTDATQSYSHAIELDPKSIDAQVGLASAKWSAGMRSQAEADFQALLKEHPRDASVYEGYGTSLLNGATDDATLGRAGMLLRRAVELDNSRAEAYYQIGLFELKKNGGEASSESMRQALQALRDAVRLGLNDGKVHYALARVYRRLGRNEEAAAEMGMYQHALEGIQGK